MIDLTTIISASIYCAAISWVIWMVSKSILKLNVSRSHLHSFNRRAEKLLASQKQEYQNILAKMQQEIDQLKSKVDSITMQL